MREERFQRVIALRDRIYAEDPTTRALRYAFDFLNTHLFDDAIWPCHLRVDDLSQEGAVGFFRPASTGDGPDEIALDRTYVRTADERDVLATLAHELSHAHDADHGLVGEGGFHGPTWVATMKRIGLEPTDTGMAGGAQTGTELTHLIVEGGPFDLAYRAFKKSGFRLRP